MEMTDTKSELDDAEAKPRQRRNRGEDTPDDPRRRVAGVCREWAKRRQHRRDCGKGRHHQAADLLLLQLKEELFAAVRRGPTPRCATRRRNSIGCALQPKAALRGVVDFTLTSMVSSGSSLVRRKTSIAARHLTLLLNLNEDHASNHRADMRLLARGVAAGIFRRGVDPNRAAPDTKLAWFFHQVIGIRLSRRFNYDMSSRAAKLKRKKQIFDLMWRYVRAIHNCGRTISRGRVRRGANDRTGQALHTKARMRLGPPVAPLTLGTARTMCAPSAGKASRLARHRCPERPLEADA